MVSLSLRWLSGRGIKNTFCRDVIPENICVFIYVRIIAREINSGVAGGIGTRVFAGILGELGGRSLYAHCDALPFRVCGQIIEQVVAYGNNY